MNRFAILAMASALAVGGCGGAKDAGSKDDGTAAATIKPASGASWIDTTSETADGGMLRGNPNAAVKLMEYGALSCPHCAKFAADSDEALRKYIEKGTVSYELRTFLIHPQDVPASLLARCNGAGAFFAIADQMFATQNDWLGKSASITPADQQGWSKMTPNQVALELAGKLGLIDFVKQRGIPEDKAKACLADPAGIATLEKIVKEASDKYQISATPTFIINGVKVENVGTWADLEPKLRDAGA
jgi:protein-disulfide isomerase